MYYRGFQAIAATDQTMFETLRYTIRCSNIFFRTIRSHGIGVPEPYRAHAVEAGRDMNVIPAFAFACFFNFYRSAIGLVLIYIALSCHFLSWSISPSIKGWLCEVGDDVL